MTGGIIVTHDTNNFLIVAAVVVSVTDNNANTTVVIQFLESSQDVSVSIICFPLLPKPHQLLVKLQSTAVMKDNISDIDSTGIILK